VRVEKGVTVRLDDVSHGSVVVEDVADVTVASAVEVLSSSVHGSLEEVVDSVRVIVGLIVVVLSVHGSSVGRTKDVLSVHDVSVTEGAAVMVVVMSKVVVRVMISRAHEGSRVVIVR